MLWLRFKLRLSAALATAALSAGGAARAQQLPTTPPPVRFEVRWTDAVVLGAAAALTALPLFQSDSVASPCPCDVGALWGIDRGTVGAVDSKTATASTVANVVTMGLATTDLLLSRPGESWDARRSDLMVLAQAITITSALTQVIKTATDRPRPFVYEAQPVGNVRRTDVTSFPSGHTSTAFAAAAAYWSTVHRRGVASQHRVEIVSLFLLAASTGALRVAAHKHFPTDVVAGAALGTAVGWALPALHPVR
jgi:membrane-associated phospholipid phosphatase